MDLIPALLGWPSVFAAVVVCIFGLVRERWQWLFVAAALVGPISAYLAMNPKPGPVALVIPLCLGGAALSSRLGYRRLTFGLLLPPTLLFVYVAMLVIGE